VTTIANAEAFAAAMERRGRVLVDELDVALEQGAIDFVNEMAERASTGPLTDRSGDLANSFQKDIQRTGSNQYSLKRRLVAFSAGVPYARVQEHGAKIRPVAKQFLTVPLEAAKTAKGVTRGPARSFSNSFLLKLGARPNTPRDMKQFGSWFIVRPGSGPAGLEWLFQLRKEVEVPGRLGFYETWRETGWPNIRTRLRAALAKAFS